MDNMSQEDSSHKEAIGQFVAFTGADEGRAKSLLEACDWNLELAINMHVDTDDGRGNKASTLNSGAGPSTSRSAVPQATLSDSVDDETETDLPPHRFRQSNNLARRSIPRPAAHNSSSDNVRPPIPPIRQVLVHQPMIYSDEPSVRRPGARGSSTFDVYDAFRDFQAEAQWQEAQAEGESSSTSESSAPPLNKRTTLQDLFRPPLDIMFRGSLMSAREAGQLKNKWLLVNIQNGKEFACQILNRDVWSNQTVKDILKEHFIFWQVYHDSFEGSRYSQFYKVSSFPHLSIIDPRTGEQVKSWPNTIDHSSFCDSVIEFLTEHPSPDGSGDGNATMKKLRVQETEPRNTLYDQSEEAQLEAAIKASLQETENSNSSKAFGEDDSYTDGIESDIDQTQSSFHARASNSSSSNVVNNEKQQQLQQHQQQASNGQGPSTASFRDIGKNASTSNSHQSNSSPPSSSPPQASSPIVNKEIVEVEDYRKYLGSNTQKFSDLVFRFPDGSRDQFKFPSDSTLRALFLFLSSKGYGMEQFNYVTNFPRRLLHELPGTDTLSDAKLIRETIFVERRPEE